MIDVLIFGCGNIGGGFDAARPTDAWPLTHAGAFVRDGRFRLAACIDPDPSQRAAFAARWGVDRAVAAPEELAGCRFDVVSIASPTACHGNHLDAALRFLPRLIFCEKPVTPTVEETQRCIDRVAAAGVLLAVNHNRRWAPDVIALAAELAAGVHGAVRSATGWYAKGVLNNGAHMIDLLQMLLGPVEVAMAGRATYDFWDDDPTVPAFLYAGGVPVHLVAGDARDHARFELEVATESGVFTMEDGGQAWRIRGTDTSAAFTGYRMLTPGARRPGRYDEAMAAAVANIYDALTHNVPLASNGTSALAAQLVCARIRALSESSR